MDKPIKGSRHSIQRGRTLYTGGTDNSYTGDGHYKQGGRTLHTGGTDTTYRGEEHFINRDGYLIYRGHTLYTVGGGGHQKFKNRPKRDLKNVEKYMIYDI